MVDPSREPHPHSYRQLGASQGSGAMLSAMAGAVLGAAGLAWWLLSEAEARRQRQQGRTRQRLSRLQGEAEPADDIASARPIQQRDLHDRVHELNQAIDDVRRQLEAMSSQP